MNPFDHGYFTSEQLRQFGFARVGEACAIARTCTIIGLENIVLGDHVRIDGYTSLIAKQGSLRIGSHVHLCSGCVIGARGGVELGDFSSLSHGVKLLSAVDDFSGERMTNSTLPEHVLGVAVAPIKVGRHVPIGSGALLLPGTEIDEGVAIHAFSVVVGTLPAWTVYGGNPAKPLGSRSRQLLDHAARLADDDQP
jgi:galactoside O-acetyltransferase